MKQKNVLIKGEALQASVVSALAAEQFLNDNYLFRRNVLNGKVEFSVWPSDGQEAAFMYDIADYRDAESLGL